MRIKNDSQQAKIRLLREAGTLNPEPEKVRDMKFLDGEFFDPHDMVQVRYEMLRRVSVDKASVSDVAEEYGVSRPTYYQTKAGFEEAGIAGLLPKKRGPHGPHKLEGSVLEFIQKHLIAGEPVRARALTRQIAEKFGIEVHPRTIERAVVGKKTAR
ncbi:MAG: helix-turn-helix domain-containing protein [Acidobacteriaceae bacterium]|nr:helix-turn-helix domain-containing protein [Acidobacteriaceae bacterium]